MTTPRTHVAVSGNTSDDLKQTYDYIKNSRPGKSETLQFFGADWSHWAPFQAHHSICQAEHIQISPDFLDGIPPLQKKENGEWDFEPLRNHPAILAFDKKLQRCGDEFGRRHFQYARSIHVDLKRIIVNPDGTARLGKGAIHGHLCINRFSKTQNRMMKSEFSPEKLNDFMAGVKEMFGDKWPPEKSKRQNKTRPDRKTRGKKISFEKFREMDKYRTHWHRDKDPINTQINNLCEQMKRESFDLHAIKAEVSEMFREFREREKATPQMQAAMHFIDDKFMAWWKISEELDKNEEKQEAKKRARMMRAGTIAPVMFPPEIIAAMNSFSESHARMERLRIEVANLFAEKRFQAADRQRLAYFGKMVITAVLRRDGTIKGAYKYIIEDAESLRRLMPTIHRLNVEKHYDVYAGFHPDDKNRVIILDDLDKAKLARLKKEIGRKIITVETSPDNYTCVIQCDRDITQDERTRAKLKWGGDMACNVSATRLAGTMNIKRTTYTPTGEMNEDGEEILKAVSPIVKMTSDSHKIHSADSILALCPAMEPEKSRATQRADKPQIATIPTQPGKTWADCAVDDDKSRTDLLRAIYLSSPLTKTDPPLLARNDPPAEAEFRMRGGDGAWRRARDRAGFGNRVGCLRAFRDAPAASKKRSTSRIDLPEARPLDVDGMALMADA
jgi:hypothetical protein